MEVLLGPKPKRKATDMEEDAELEEIFEGDTGRHGPHIQLQQPNSVVHVAKTVHVRRRMSLQYCDSLGAMVPYGTDAAEGHEWISECLYALPPMTVYCWEAGDLCPEFFTNRIPNPRRALSPDLHPLQRRRWADVVRGGGRRW